MRASNNRVGSMSPNKAGSTGADGLSAARRSVNSAGRSARSVVVETDLAELVDDHRGAGKLRAFEQPSEQRGLAAAEKSGEHADRDHGGTRRDGAMRSRLV